MAAKSSVPDVVELLADGSMKHPWYSRFARETKVVKNFVWKDRLEYVGMIKGRSSLQFEWRSVDSGKLFYMLKTTFDELMQQSDGVPAFVTHTHSDKDSFSSKSIIVGKFTFEKKGGMLGVKLLKD